MNACHVIGGAYAVRQSWMHHAKALQKGVLGGCPSLGSSPQQCCGPCRQGLLPGELHQEAVRLTLEQPCLEVGSGRECYTPLA